jgi:hypothetical protein
MRDDNLRSLLRHEVWVERPVVAVNEGNPTTPHYEREATARRALVQPLTGTLRSELPGRLPEATHVVYLEEMVEAGERLLWGDERFEVQACENQGGQGHHFRAVIKADRH